MKKKKQNILLNNIPNEVLAVWASHYSGVVSADAYNNAIEKYPEYFPEEVEYRRKWESVPQEVKDKYQDSTYRLQLTDQEEKERLELFGECPHPDLQGCGIIQRVTTHEHRHADFVELDAWNDKWYKHQHRKNVDLYNKLFNPYGLSKTYDQ